MCCVALRGGLHFTSPQFAHLQSGNHNIQFIQLVRKLEVITVSLAFSRALEILCSPIFMCLRNPVQSAPCLFCNVATRLHLRWCPCLVLLTLPWIGLGHIVSMGLPLSRGCRQDDFQKRGFGPGRLSKVLPVYYTPCLISCVYIMNVLLPKMI